MQNLNHAIATGRIATGDIVTFDDTELIIPVDPQELAIKWDSEYITLYAEDGLPVYKLPRHENPSAGTGQYVLSTNNVISHTWEHKLLVNKEGGSL